MASPPRRRPISTSRSTSSRSPRPPSSARCRRRPTTTTRSASPTRPRPGATGCSTAWPRTTTSRREQADAAKAQPIAPAASTRPDTLVGSEWFADEVKRELIDHYGNDVATEGGLAVRTTLDPALQARGRSQAARRADRIRPPARQLARSGGAAQRHRGAEDRLAHPARRRRQATRHAARLAARRGARRAGGLRPARLARYRLRPRRHAAGAEARHDLSVRHVLGPPQRRGAAPRRRHRPRRATW